MWKHLEVYFIDVVKSKRRGVFAAFLRGVLWVLSGFYKFLSFSRNWAFDTGWFRRYSPPVPVVISIGNIVVGGTGKTPVTLLLAQKFIDTYLTAILSRGYRSPAERLITPVVLSHGAGPIHPASYCGDEPYLLASNMPSAIVIVGKDRHQASNIAAKAGAQLILLDDGMQHRRLARDFEVIVMDVRDPYGQGYFLPRGFLREGSSALKRADLIILNHAYELERYQTVRKQVKNETAAPIIGTRLQVVDILDFSGESIGTIKGRKVAIFCGIAHPESFQGTVLHQGASIVASDFVPDHRSFDWEHLKQFAEQAKHLGAEMLLCTEKDRVKFSDIQDVGIPLAWVKTRLIVVDGEPEWNHFISQVRNKLQAFVGV